MKTAKMRLFCDISFLAALLLKVFSKGLTYFPVLDDYIQYGGYPLYENLSHVYLNIGTIVTRPFAALLDPAVWGQFYPNLWIVLLIISILFFFGAKLIAGTFERTGIFITPFLYAIVLLIPLGFEGTYWISASSRICVGLFATGVASALLVRMITQKKKWLFAPYIITTLLSFGFYESVMVFSAFLQFVVIMGFVKNNKKRLVYLLTPVILGISMLVYYKMIAGISTLASRVNTFEFSMLLPNIRELFAQFAEIIVYGGTKTTLGGAKEGIYLALLSPLLAIGVIAVSALCGYFGAKAPFVAKAKYCIPIGLGFMIFPLLPNLLTDTVWLTYRSIVPSLFGLVLISASILAILLKNSRVRGIVIFVMVLIFMLGNLSELHTYKNVHENDDALVDYIAQQLDNEVLSGNKETIVVVTEGITKPVPQVSYYKDHVKSVIDSDWALTGAVRAKTRNIKIKMITPMDAGLFALADIDTSSVQIIYIGGNNE